MPTDLAKVQESAKIQLWPDILLIPSYPLIPFAYTPSFRAFETSRFPFSPAAPGR
jgi:hypothetical protein